MKISVIVIPDSIHHQIIIEMMEKTKGTEFNRTVVGGDSSEVHLVLSYEINRYDWEFWNRPDSSFCIQYKLPKESRGGIYGNDEDINEGMSYFYSLNCLSGYMCKTIKDFKKYLKDKENPNFKFHNLNR